MGRSSKRREFERKREVGWGEKLIQERLKER